MRLAQQLGCSVIVLTARSGVEALVNFGCKNIVVTGTCYEYGNINGCLEENLKVDPNNLYAIAKDSLRRSIQIICEKNISSC